MSADADALLLVVSRVGAALDRLGVPWMVGGSLATSAYGEPRSNHDVDIVADAVARAALGRRVRWPVTPSLVLPLASPQDMLVEKLPWYRWGGEVSERQWRDLLERAIRSAR